MKLFTGLRPGTIAVNLRKGIIKIHRRGFQYGFFFYCKTLQNVFPDFNE
jgi:hypothetical protein